MWDGGQYVAYGNGAVLTSTDGTVWAGKEVPDVTLNSGKEVKYHIADILWDGKQYIAVGDNETVITSADGVTWTVAPVKISNDDSQIASPSYKLIIID